MGTHLIKSKLTRRSRDEETDRGLMPCGCCRWRDDRLFLKERAVMKEAERDLAQSKEAPL